MIRLLKLLLFTIHPLLSLLPENALAQERKFIPLNQHFYEIEEKNSQAHSYNRIITFGKDSTEIERVFDLQNRLIRVQKTKMNEELGFMEQSEQVYDESGSLIESTLRNLDNHKFIRTYFFDEQQIGQILYEGDKQYFIALAGETEPTLTNANEFEPQMILSESEYSDYILKAFRRINSKFVKTRYQKVVVGILINEDAIIEKIEWVNPLEAEEYVAKELIKVFYEMGKVFIPARDSFGNTVSKWLYIPIKFNFP